MANKNRSKVRSLEERMRLAKAISEARAAHPKLRIAEILKQFPGVTEGNYYSWNERRTRADTVRKSNGEEHFPLAAIPSRPKRPATGHRTASHSDLALTLLDVAMKLLKGKS